MSHKYRNIGDIQSPSVAAIGLTAAALTANGNKVSVPVPAGAIIIAASVAVHTLFAGTTTTANVGDADDPDRYGTAALATVGLRTLTPTGFKIVNGGNVELSGLAGLTAGEATLILQYVVPGRGSEYTSGNFPAPSEPANPGPNY